MSRNGALFFCKVVNYFIIITIFAQNLKSTQVKKFLSIFLALALVVACNTGEDIPTVDNPDPIPGASDTVTSINAKIEGSTRASLVVESDGDYQGYWSKGDALFVTDMSKSATFTLASGDGGVKGTFTGSLTSDSSTLYALYPATNASLNGSYITYTIPTAQTFSPVLGTNIKDKVLFFGKSTDRENFTMTSIAAVIRFNITLPADEVIKSVTMTTEQLNIAGKGSFTLANQQALSANSKTLTLTYANQPKGRTTDGWATIAAVNFKDATDRVLYDIKTADGQYTFCHKPTEKFVAGGLYTVNLSVEEYNQIELRDRLKEGEYYSSKGMPEDAPEPGSVARGRVTYTDGTPAVGVSVSDGFSVVQTDAEGKYTLTPHKDTWYIYYSLPSDCVTTTNSKGQPAFFTKYDPYTFNYDFKLTKNANGKESKWSLFCLADPQCANAGARSRFQAESVPHIKALAASKGVPCYGVTLGDIVSSGNTSNTTPHMPYMRDHMAISKTGIPIYQTMGNHDYLYFNASAPIEPDETSSTYNIKAQRLFEDTFGPVNHSWNRGDAHIVCMRDMLWKSNNDGGNYSLGFSNEQYEWLKQDLKFVPKDKLVILCVHIPLVNSNNTNVQNVISLLAAYDEAHIMAGHTHYTRNEPTLSKGVFEHVHGAVCGAWWHSNTNGDGTPNGYGVYDIEGNTIKNWYYQGVNTGQNDRDYQIRLYRGNHKSGGQYEYFAQQHGDGVLLANIFNADDSWSIKVYEDGVYSGTMSKIAYKKETPTKGTGIDNPTKPSTKSSQDWWAAGYLVGVKNRSRSNYFTSCFHLYKYTLKNKNAKVRVEATDRFGRTYSCDKITEDYDYSLMDVK